MAARKSDKKAGKPPIGYESDKQKAVDLAISSIEKQFGKGSIMKDRCRRGHP